MKIKIHDTTYIFLLLSFLSGYFEYIFLFLLIIFIHESGHYFFSMLIKFKFEEIIIYPFGGITKYNESLNVSTNKELFVLSGGIILQLLFLYFINILFNNNLVTLHTFEIIKKINIVLISFNFMPILPLDGGKLLNLILDKIFTYRLSNIISIVISFLFLIFFFFYDLNILNIILSIFLLKCIVIEITNIRYKYNKFLLERYLNDYKFNKIKIINNINKFKRDYYHIINNTFERDYLHNLFDRSR